MKHKLASQIVVLFTLLALMFSAVGPAQAAGIYTHSVFVERAIERLTAYGGYSELVNILNTYPGVVNYGSTFPDTTLGSFNILGIPIPAPDEEWAETVHDTGGTRSNYTKYLQYLVDKGYDRSNSDLQTGYYKAFLEDPNYTAEIPAYRAALMGQMLQYFNASPRSFEDEKKIAFLFGLIAHQEADLAWHWTPDPGWVPLETAAINLGKSEYDLEIITKQYNGGNNAEFTYASYIKQDVLAASDAMGSRRPYCHGPCVAYPDDPILTGNFNLGVYWNLPAIGADGAWDPWIKTYVPGGIDYGSALVAGAWMQTWDKLSDASTYYVKPVASGNGNCSSWANACTLQSALNQAVNGEIWAAVGTYKPTDLATSRDIAFRLRTGVSVYGGFAGTETSRDQRDPEANLTILSGDIDNNDINTDGNNVAETYADIVGNNSYHVVVGATGATLDGFTVTAGNANVGTWPDTTSGGGGMLNYTDTSPVVSNIIFSGNSAVEAGGGMLNYTNSSPTVTNVTFVGNLAKTGGGMNNYYSSPTLTNGTFSNNSAEAGGGMINNNSSPTVTNVTFSANEATITSGGGMFNYSNSSPTLMNVTFNTNSAVYGGGMLNEANSSPTLTSVTFSGNSASFGGGMYNKHGNPTVTNVTFSGNSASFNGGGMYNEYGNTVITNVTFSGNSVSGTGGGMYNEFSNPIIRNSVLWGDGGDEISNVLSSTPTVTDSVVEGGYAGGTNIITTDPKLGVLGIYGGLTQTIPLLAGSSAINMGNDATCSATDQRGVTRPQGLHCDIGAYEYVFTDVYYAKPAATGTGNCQSWSNACTLQTALNAWQGGEVWVMAGTHQPGALRADTFQLKPSMAVYGGFAGTETARNQRNPVANLTILSGDIDNDDINTDGNDIAETYADIVGNNAYHVVTGATGATLDGFTITAGNANDVAQPNNQGGGMYNNAVTSSTLSNLVFSGNSASGTGGGMDNHTSNPTLTNITFVGNLADAGGAIFNWNANPTLTNITFKGNAATYGGGIASHWSNLTLTNVTFSSNTGIDIYNDWSTSAEIRNSILWGNSGGQIFNYNSGSATVSNSVIQNGYAGGTNIITTDPLLGTLGNHGGFTPTFPLLPGSSAIDTGDDATCPATDQRGVARPQRSHCDIGAYEADFRVISGNAGTSDASITYTGGTVTTDETGAYSFIVGYGWSGTVTPSKSDYVFSPANLSFTNVQNDFTDQNFTVTTWPAWSGGVSLTSDQPVVTVGRPHVGAEVMTYNGFGSGSTTMYVPMLFKNAFGGSYNAALYLQNISDTTSANVSISYYDSTGALTCSVTNETLTPLAIKGYWLPTVGCLPVGWVGGAVVTSDQPIVAVGRPHVGSQVTTYAGFASGSLSMYAPMLFKNAFGGGYNAALYIQNTDAALSATVDIEFYDSAGSLTCALTGETIAALATKGYWIPSISCLPVGWVGGAVITSNREIVAVGRPHIGSQVTTYNGFSAGSPSLRVPMLFKNAFAGGTYNAALYIQNADPALAATVDIDFYDSNGSLTCSLTGETIAALATKGYWIPSISCLPVSWVGGAVITANRDVVAVGRPHVGAEVATYGGFTSGSTEMYLPMLFKDAFGGSYDSAVYVQNTSGGSPAKVTFKFYDTVGNLSCLKTASIPAGATVGYWLPTLTCNP